MSRSWTTIGKVYYGQVHCHRERCHIAYRFPVENPPPQYCPTFMQSQEDKDAHTRLQRLASQELEDKALPVGYVKVSYDNSRYEFCSPNCAALWLKSRPAVSEERAGVIKRY